MALTVDAIKLREIVFHPSPPAQTERAHALLAGLPGLQVMRQGERQLVVQYSIADYTLETLETLLTEQGFHLEGTLLIRLKRALVYHLERVQRENLDRPEVLTKNYQPHIQVWDQRPHGDRDETPREWRQYK